MVHEESREQSGAVYSTSMIQTHTKTHTNTSNEMKEQEGGMSHEESGDRHVHAPVQLLVQRVHGVHRGGLGDAYGPAEGLQTASRHSTFIYNNMASNGMKFHLVMMIIAPSPPPILDNITK